MPTGKIGVKKKYRPSTAPGILQSHDVKDLLDDVRPRTSLGKNVVGLDPTYITSRHHVPGALVTSKFKGRQVHGGLPDPDYRGATRERRGTLAGLEDIQKHELNRQRRPATAVHRAMAVKLEDRITLDHLHRMRKAFEDADVDGSETLDLSEFKAVIQDLFGVNFKNEDQVTALFMKIDFSSDGEINWDEFCTFMQLEYAEKEECYVRSKEISFAIPTVSENSSQRETVIRLCHMADSNFLCVSQDGLVSFWSPNMEFKRIKHIETSSKNTKWITDFVLMPQFNKFIISTGDREIQFFEQSTFEPYCQISGLETTPLKIDYCSTGTDECTIIYGDSQGCVNIFIMKAVGETLRNWKKLPKVEGIASVNIDSVMNSEHTKFIRWKVHGDWVLQLKYYHSLRAVISCCNHPNTALVIGQTMGSTHLETTMKEISNGHKRNTTTAARDAQPRKRLDTDQTVFRVYKGVKTFDFCKEKNVIVTGGMDRLVRMWNPYVPSKPVGILRGHTAPICHLFIAPEDERIFTFSTDKTVKVWDLHDHTCLLTLRPKSHKVRGDISAIHYNPLCRGIAIATSDQIAVLPLRTRSTGRDVTTSHKEPVTCMKFNSSFKHVVTASEGSVVKIWDIETGHQVFEFNQAHGDTAVTAMTFDSTERRLITGGRDGRLRIWNYNNGHCIRLLEKESGMDEVTDIIYLVLNKNRYIISVGWDRRINLFSDDNEDFHHVQYPYAYWSDDLKDGHKEDILSVTSSPPNFLATSSYDGEIIIWNQISGHIFCHIFSPHTVSKNDDKYLSMDGVNAISKLVFLKTRCANKKAATLVANGPKGLIHFWNIYSNGTLFACFNPTKESTITAMATDSRNTKLFTADNAGFVTIWDIQDYCLHGKCDYSPPVSLKWRSHCQSITGIELAESYNTLLTSSVDWTVRLWTWEGHFIGTLGQPKLWDLKLPSSYQHPMAPYDVLVDPGTLPKHPVLEKNDSVENILHEDAVHSEDNEQDSGVITQPVVLQPKNEIIIDDKQIAEELKMKIPTRHFGKRLRHEKLKRIPRDVGGPNAYQTLTCFELDDTPSLPSPPTPNIDDPYDI